MDDLRVEVNVPEPKFTLFNATRSGKPEVVVVNESLLAFRHLDVFPWHLVVTLEATESVESGMPSPSESEVLFDIGDEIEDVVLRGKTEHGSSNALFLARSTWNECRELMFQVHNPEIAHSDLQALLGSREWARPWEYRMESDLEWSNAAHLFTLFRLARGSDA